MPDLASFLDYLKYQRHYSNYTVLNYEKDITGYLEYLDRESLSYLDIEYSDLRLYLIYLKSDLQMKASSIDRHLSSLRSFYRYLCANGKIKSNPFILMRGLKKEKVLPRYFEYYELELLFKVPDLKTPLGQRNRLILEILYATGIRVGELVKIKWSDINEVNRQILITGKGNKERYVPYGDYAAKILELYKKDGYKILNSNNSSYAFLNQHGEVLTTRGVSYILDEIIKKTSINKNISPHMIRHSFATHLLNAGCDILSVQELLGHESVSSTQIYTHLTVDYLKEIYHKSFPRSKDPHNQN